MTQKKSAKTPRKSRPSSSPRILTSSIISRLSLGSHHAFADIEDIDSLLSSQDGNYRTLDADQVRALKESIKETGVTDPITIDLVLGDGEERALVLVKGHHRLEAVRQLRQAAKERNQPWLYRTLPCLVDVVAKNVSNSTLNARQTTANLARQDSVWEKAEAFTRLKSEGKSQTEIAKISMVDERTVSRYLAVLSLPQVVQAFAKAVHKDLSVKTLCKLAEDYRALTNGRSKSLLPPIGASERDILTSFIEKELKSLNQSSETVLPRELDMLLIMAMEVARKRKLLTTEKASKKAVTQSFDTQKLRSLLLKEKIASSNIEKIMAALGV